MFAEREREENLHEYGTLPTLEIVASSFPSKCYSSTNAIRRIRMKPINKPIKQK